jgi:hypothetical protein
MVPTFLSVVLYNSLKQNVKYLKNKPIFVHIFMSYMFLLVNLLYTNDVVLKITIFNLLLLKIMAVSTNLSTTV